MLQQYWSPQNIQIISSSKLVPFTQHMFVFHELEMNQYEIGMYLL
jgi:hypothetical protein